MNRKLMAGLALMQVAFCLPAETHWRVIVSSLARDELIAIALPSPLFARGPVDAATLRVRDDRGGDVPTCYEAIQTVAHTRRHVPTAPFDLVAAELPGGTLRLTLQRPATKPPEGAIEGITIQTPLRNFEQQATVEISDDGVAWTTLVAHAAIFDFSRHADVRRTEIAFPGSLTNRHLRLTFTQAVDVREQLTALITDTQASAGDATRSRAVQVDSRPFHVAAVRGWTSSRIEASREPVLVAYPIAWTPLTNGTPRGRTRYAIDAQGQPLSRLALTVPGDYASWRYTLTADSAAPSGPLAQGLLTQFRFRGVVEGSTAIVFPETRARRYLLTIDHPRATVSGIQAQGPGYRLVFPAQPQRRYTLIHLQEPGAQRLVAAQIADLLAKGVQPIEATLAPTPQVATTRGRGFDWLRRHAFHVGVGVALLALAASLAKAMRRI